jgi:CheY-like chemotaxis protein
MSSAPQAGDAQALNSRKVLLVEDEEALANVLKLKLAAKQFDVTWVRNGVEALSDVAKDHFDVIVTDLILPEMDGFTMLEKFQEKKLNTPIIVLTNLGQPEDIEQAKALGVQEFLVKSNVPLSRIPEYINKAIT